MMADKIRLTQLRKHIHHKIDGSTFYTLTHSLPRCELLTSPNASGRWPISASLIINRGSEPFGDIQAEEGG